MYLATLNEKEKNCFLGLAYQLSNIDGEYSDEERVVMDEYCHEMRCTFDEEITKKTKDELFEELESYDDQKTKKIFIFELVGLAVVDGRFDETEKAMLADLCQKVDIDVEFVQECEVVLNEYVQLQMRLNTLVLG